MFLGRPEGDIDDQATPAAHHLLRRQTTRDEIRADACREHRVPTRDRLPPERPRPREFPVLEHLFIAAPDAVGEDIKSTLLRKNSGERRFDLCVVCVVARNRDAFSGELGLRHCSSGYVDSGSRIRECLRNPLTHASAAARHQRDSASQRPLLSHAYRSERLSRVLPNGTGHHCGGLPSPTSAAMKQRAGRSAHPD